MNLLIADDHPIVRSGLKQILGAEPDMNVVGEGQNGDETLELARKLPWDVLVLDYSMPGWNGLDLIRELRREFPSRPILVLSMMPEEVHAAQVYKAGGNGFVKKETACDELPLAIRKVARGGRYVSPSFAEKLAEGLSNSHADKPLHELLTDREYRVMWLLATGKAIKDIANAMKISPSTVSTYRARVMRKLMVNDNAGLVRYAISHQLA